MRALAILVVAACGSRDPAPTPAPTPTPTSAAPPRPLFPPARLPHTVVPEHPRGANEVDERGVGPLAVGTSASALAALGFTLHMSEGHASFTQDGKDVTTAVSFGGTATLDRDGKQELVVEIEAMRHVVTSIRIAGTRPKTAEGIGVGATEAELTGTYGAPDHRHEACVQFAGRPGVDFCLAQGVVTSLVVPAPHRRPLSGRFDTAPIAAALEGRLIRGGVFRAGKLVMPGRASLDAELVAPCMIEFRDPTNALAPELWTILPGAHTIYSAAGGWRDRDGLVVCSGSSIFEQDAAGATVRWMPDGSGWTSERATCTIEGKRVSCEGSSDRSGGFDGELDGARIVPRDREFEEHRLRALDAAADDCERIVDRVWPALAPAYALAGRPHDEAARIAYYGDKATSLFAMWCNERPAEEQRCRLAARDVLRRQEGCANPPGFGIKALLEQPAPRALAPEEQHARASAFAGTWERRDKYGVRTWKTVGDEMLVDGKRAGTISFPHAGELITDAPRIETHYAVAFAGDKLYTDDARVQCPGDPAHAVLREVNDTLIVRDDRCAAVTQYGAVSEARCTREGDVLSIAYTDTYGDAMVAKFLAVDGCLVDQEVIPFVRMKR